MAEAYVNHLAKDRASWNHVGMGGIRIEQLDPTTIPPVASRTFVATQETPDTDVTESDFMVAVDASAVSSTAFLRDANQVKGRSFKIAKTENGGNILTIRCTVPSQLVNGSQTHQMVGIGAVTVTSDGSNYYIG
jgi:hypothetical protein